MVLRLCLSLVLALVTLAGCTADAPSYAALTAAANLSEGTGSTTTESTTHLPADTTAPSTTTGATMGAADSGTSDASASEAGPTTADDAELLPPQILAVDMPDAVHMAGPVAVQVTAERATAVRATLDGLELAPFVDQGGGVWLGAVPIFGSVDEGDHVVEVTATHGPLLATWPPLSLSVSTPEPGTQAWAVLAPPASTTRRAAVTPEGDLLEVGASEVEGVMKPAIRKRSAKNGGEPWPEGTIVLDAREGSADAIAVRADGWMWVAMNVADPNNKKWQPRIVLLDAEGHATGVEAPTEPGPSVRGIAATEDGGFFAVGFGASGFGDIDVAHWRMTGEDVATATAKRWDYWPMGNKAFQHTFDDMAFDVVVTDGVAWVVGASTGDHDELKIKLTRGFVVRLDVETGAQLGPGFVAAPVTLWRHSMFLAASHHPDGVIVTGNESTIDGIDQRITVQAFDASGARIYHKSEWIATVAYGTGVAWSVHGAVLATGAVHDGDGLRGILYGRGAPGLNFDHWFPGTEPSAANGLALDAYEQVYLVGERTIGGVRQARAARIHR
ncbi:hypothetical protein [Nannocystis bainbridge]|uniref:Lipoprotein n=1 Tax=Nannocystis bainbridge TaxID=2995303 RepID=A0ABT5E4F2_9BACT|nr:hypothetical protein [Nannocystis bainbridge]MDC0720615.1 hypothetical protein [Nannocystis bainbridge]